jgi:VWFA-related protein
MRMRSRLSRLTVRAAIMALSIFLAWPLAGADRKDNKLVEHSESILIEVPLHVSLGEEPVRGLTAANFEIYDSGKRQEITGFNVLDLSLTTAGEVPSPRHAVSLAARRHFLLLFDVSFSSPVAIRRSQLKMRDWVKTQLHPWDLVGVGIYSATTGADLLLNFTSDRKQLELAIESLGLPQYVDRGIDPLALEIGVAVPGVSPLDAEDPGVREKGGTASNYGNQESNQIAAMRQIYHSVYEPVKRQGARQQILALTRSIGDFAERVRAVRGRKHVIYLSQGFDSSLAYARTDTESVARRANTFQTGPGAISSIKSEDMFGDSATQNGINTMIDELRRADCTIQAIQIGASDSQDTLASTRSEGLFIMADKTGGELYRDFNNLEEVMTNLLEKTSVTYVLSFRPEEFNREGRFHKLKVKLIGAPKKARVVHRPGYYEPKLGERLTSEELRMQAAGRIMEGRDGDGTLAASILASPFHDGDSSYVPVLIEVDGASLPNNVSDGHMQFDIFLYALAADGSIADFFTQRLNVDLATFGGKLAQSGLKMFGDLSLPAGEYSLRLFVHEGRFGLYSTRAATLSIPSFSSLQPTVLPPLFPEPRGKWLVVRENTGAGEESEHPYPFMQRNEPYLPAALPELASHSEAVVYLVVYDLGDGPVSIYTEVIDLLGATHDEPRLRLLERTDNETASGGQEVLIGRFHPHGLASGQYTLLVTVANDRTGKSQTNSIPIQVVEQARNVDVPGRAH